MGRRITVLLLFLSLLGCSPTPVVPSATPATVPAEMQIATIVPSTTKAPSTFTPTAFPLLQTRGPYFSYFKQVGEEYQFVMMDANGQGRKTIAIPGNLTDSLVNIPVDLDINRVSPNGEWLAYYTGSAGFPELIQPEKDFDLSLNLYNFITGELRVVSLLLSEDYPNNFIEAAKRLNNPSITDITLYQAFLNGIDSLAWSPDGSYLAFAGQMDGLSSDLYVYNMGTESIRRLSSGNQQIQTLHWSPDGKWILYSGANKIEMDMKFDIYAASVDGVSVKHLSTTTSPGFPMWIDSDVYIEHDRDNENVLGEFVGDFGFRWVEISTGQIRKIWDGPISDYGANAEKKKFIFITHLFSHSPSLNLELEPDFVPGIYLMDLDTFSVVSVKVPADFDFQGSYFIDEFNLNENLFIVTSYDGINKPYLLSDTGDLTVLDIGGVRKVVSSPDSKMWIAIKDKAVDIYSTDNTLINTIPLPFKDASTAFFDWRLDSTGLFVVHEFKLYSMDVLTGEIVLIEPEFIRSLFSSGVRWFVEE